MERQQSRIVNTILKNNKVESLIIPEFKTKHNLKQSRQHSKGKEHIDQRNRIENPEIDHTTIVQ